MASRDIKRLTPPIIHLVEHFLEVAKWEDFPLLVYCANRAVEEQARLWRIGRHAVEIQAGIERLHEYNPILADILRDVGPQPGRRKVTWAMPGQSAHNYGLAIDGCPMRDGKPVWGTVNKADRKVWEQYVSMAESIPGLEPGGRWPGRKRDFPHIQMANFNWRSVISTPLAQIA